MKHFFELTPFEKELKFWYTNHQELMPWELFLIREKEIRKTCNTESDLYTAIDPCYRSYENAIFDKNHGYVNLSNLQDLISGQFCTLTKQPRYFPAIPFEYTAGMIFYAYSGQSTVSLIDDQVQTSYILKKGDFLFAPAHSKKTILCSADDSVMIYLTFSSKGFQLSPSGQLYSLQTEMSPSSHPAENEVLLFSTGNDHRIRSVIDAMILEASEQKPDHFQILYHYLQVLIHYLQREYQNLYPTPSTTGYTYIPEFHKYLKDHITDFALTQMADHFHLSSSHICRLYKQLTGMTLLQSLQEIRIQTAKYLLDNTYDSVENIAYQIGYTDTSYFIKIFRKNTGTTPYLYRKNK